MAITTAMTNSYRQELMVGTHNHTASTGHTFKAVLIVSGMTGTYGKSTTNYSDITGNSDEVSGPGYTTGGETLTNVTPTITNDVAITDFSPDLTLSTSTFSTDGVAIINSSVSNACVSVHDFGGTKAPSGGDFVLTFPAATSAAAVLRLA